MITMKINRINVLSRDFQKIYEQNARKPVIKQKEREVRKNPKIEIRTPKLDRSNLTSYKQVSGDIEVKPNSVFIVGANLDSKI